MLFRLKSKRRYLDKNVWKLLLIEKSLQAYLQLQEWKIVADNTES